MSVLARAGRAFAAGAGSAAGAAWPSPATITPSAGEGIVVVFGAAGSASGDVASVFVTAAGVAAVATGDGVPDIGVRRRGTIGGGPPPGSAGRNMGPAPMSVLARAAGRGGGVEPAPEGGTEDFVGPELGAVPGSGGGTEGAALPALPAPPGRGGGTLAFAFACSAGAFARTALASSVSSDWSVDVRSSALRTVDCDAGSLSAPP